MASQTFNFTSGFTATSSAKTWNVANTVGARIQDVFFDTTSDIPRLLRQVSVRSNGSVVVNINLSSQAANVDLSNAWEQNGGFTLTVGNNSLTVLNDGADTSEIYAWTPSNSAEVTAFFNAIGTTGVTATFTLFDTPPTPPNSTRLGTSEPKYRYGASEVNAMYVGTNKVFG